MPCVVELPYKRWGGADRRKNTHGLTYGAWKVNFCAAVSISGEKNYNKECLSKL